MAVCDSFLALVAFTLTECYFLHRTLFAHQTFRSMLLSLLVVNVFLKCLYNIFIWPFFVNPLRDLPKVPGFLSNLKFFDFPRRGRPLLWMKTIPNEGLIHLHDILGQSYLLVTNHRAMADVMSTNVYDFEKPWRARNFIARILGFGLVLSEGVSHKKQRKALTPAFNIKNIRALYSLMWNKTNELLEEMEKEIRLSPIQGTNLANGEGTLEMGVWASRLSLDIIGPAAMGRDFRSLQRNDDPVAESYYRLREPSFEKLVFLAINFILPQWLARHLPLRMNKVIDEEASFLRHLCQGIVSDRRQVLKISKNLVKDLETDILGMVMLGGDLSDSELVDQMLTFLAGGHETTARAITWACYLLTEHPDTQERLRCEIRAKIPSANSPITYQDLESLPLLNGVCQEVLRLYPTIPATLRESIRDTVIAGTRIPKGTRVILCPWAINRAPNFWGINGDEFSPERWIDKDKNGNLVLNNHGGASTNFAQMTFIHGQRSCIGKDFARAELRCAVAGVVGRFAFEMQNPKQEIHIAGALTTKPVEGMHLRMHRLDSW